MHALCQDLKDHSKPQCPLTPGIVPLIVRGTLHIKAKSAKLGKKMFKFSFLSNLNDYLWSPIDPLSISM